MTTKPPAFWSKVKATIYIKLYLYINMNILEGDIRKLLPNKDDQLKWIARSSHNIKRFSLKEVEAVTKKYKTLIGQGSFGEVYKGILEDKIMVAVKKFKHMHNKTKENFAKELLVHSQINHRNVTRLIGYCLEENASMIVTEFISGGNLSDFLHNSNRSMCLDTRLRIGIECAEALSYMHSHMYTRVIHGDIKPANILLDHDNLNAKISDFGISRLLNMDKTLYTMNVVGSIGYMDPLFLRHGRLTTGSDVYSFGIVLIELFTRKRVNREDVKDNLADSFTKSLSTGFRMLRDMFDAEIAEQSNMKILEGIGKLAGKCLSMDSQKRPEMIEVAERLRTLRRTLHQQEEKLPLLFWRMKYRPVAPADEIIPTTKLEPQAKPAPSLESRATASKLVTFGSMAAKVELEELLLASEVLGVGTFGTMCKAHLKSGLTLVVKRMTVHGFLSEQELGVCAAAIGAIQNELILPLRAYYFSKDEKMLIYDYMPMGSLATVLHGKWGTPSQVDLSWEQRSTIALTAARSLLAIHSAGVEACHGNIKSSNVFLTDAYEARLSEHGLLTLLYSSSYSHGGGGSGYRAPEVTDIMSVSKKADVYSFGVLLLELLTGNPPRNGMFHKERVDLRLLVLSVPPGEWVAEVIDARLRPSLQEEAMIQLLHLAMFCCQEKATDRPEITEVVQRIEYISDGC